MTPEEAKKMKADQARRQQSQQKGKAVPLKMNKNTPQKPKPVTNMKDHKVEGVGSSSMKPHNAHNLGAGSKVMAMSNIITPDPSQLADMKSTYKTWVNINDVILKNADSSYYGSSYNSGLAFYEILDNCNNTCKHDESTICAVFPGTGYDNFNGENHGPLMLPVLRQDMMTCWRMGLVKLNVDGGNIFSKLGGICSNYCNTQNCSDAPYRSLCKVLCCEKSDVIQDDCLKPYGDKCCAQPGDLACL